MSESKDHEGLNLEKLFPAWLKHFANRMENKEIKRFIVCRKLFLGKLVEWKIFLKYFLKDFTQSRKVNKEIKMDA